MQHEGVGVGTELGDDEGRTLRHKSGDESHVAGEAIELGYDHGTLAATCGGEGSSQLWPPIERVRALAAFCLDELGCEGEAFGFGELPYGFSLGVGFRGQSAAAFRLRPGSKAGSYHLTTAETRILSLLAAGMSLSQVARELGVQTSTARTHLLRLFAKTGTHRQAELIKLATSLTTP